MALETDPTATTTMSTFDRTTALGAGTEDGTFAVELDESWSSLRGLHGGYLAAVMSGAAEAMSPDREVRTSTTSFLRPSRPGPAIVRVQPVRAGRALATAAIQLEQRDRLVAVARVTLARPSAPAGPGRDWQSTGRRRPSPRHECEPLAPPPEIRHFAQATAWFDPSDVPFSSGPAARVGGHVRPLEARPIDARWLTMILDWFPPAPFARLPDSSVGGVSIDYTVHVHRVLPTLADDEWLEASFEAPVSQGGMAVEHGWIGTADGATVAEAFHTRFMR